jgi:hypothetical protein
MTNTTQIKFISTVTTNEDVTTITYNAPDSIDGSLFHPDAVGDMCTAMDYNCNAYWTITPSSDDILMIDQIKGSKYDIDEDYDDYDKKWDNEYLGIINKFKFYEFNVDKNYYKKLPKAYPHDKLPSDV